MRLPSSELVPPVKRLIYPQIITRWRGCLPGHDGRCRAGNVQWATPPPELRVEQSTLTSHPVRNVRLKDTRENRQMDVRDAKL
ncbi:hypothetical protein TNCV_4447781 [Trichonephila clavipes]|nr:hypothetical protein TNCV_4447781 [Trichonephila clavipes]